MLIIIIMLVSTAGYTRGCWEQTDEVASLNKIVIEFATSRVVFLLLQLFSGQSDIIYLFSPQPSGIWRQRRICSKKKIVLQMNMTQYGKIFLKNVQINYKLTVRLYKSVKLAEMVAEISTPRHWKDNKTQSAH